MSRALTTQTYNDINKQDSDGNTLLMRALKNEQFRIASGLINNGADLFVRNNEQKMAIHIAKDLKEATMLARTRKTVFNDEYYTQEQLDNAYDQWLEERNSGYGSDAYNPQEYLLPVKTHTQQNYQALDKIIETLNTKMMEERLGITATQPQAQRAPRSDRYATTNQQPHRVTTPATPSPHNHTNSPTQYQRSNVQSRGNGWRNNNSSNNTHVAAYNTSPKQTIQK